MDQQGGRHRGAGGGGQRRRLRRRSRRASAGLDSKTLVETIVYGRADAELLAELHRAASGRGPGHAGPNRAVVMVHGGAWCSGDRHAPAVLCQQLAAAGFTVLSLDFRDGRQAKHPCAVQDIAAGVRYVRANASELGVAADAIGLIGSSSGGHLALVAALQPDAPAHQGTRVRVGTAWVDADVSAQVAAVTALWPVSDPKVRFDYARRQGREELLAGHRRYFRDEAQMRAASVPRMIRAGECDRLPPLLLVQPGEDANVPQPMTLDLVREYQAAGGALHYQFYPGLPHGFAYEASAATTRLGAEVETFFSRQLGSARTAR